MESNEMAMWILAIYDNQGGCQLCKSLTEYFLKENPHRKGYVICEKCIEEQGIYPISMEDGLNSHNTDVKIRF